MAGNEDLIAEFGGGKTVPKIVSPNADLINQFVGPNQAVSLPKAQPQEQITYNSNGTPNPPRFVGNDPNTISSPLPTNYEKKLYGDAQAEDFAAARKQFGEGVNEIQINKSASGLGNAAMGLVGMPLSLVSPIIKAGTSIINKTLPGNPQGKGVGTGEKLGMILPIKGAGSFAKAQLPSNIAIENLISAIGKENLPEVVRRMKANPRISPMDVNNGVLQVAQKLAVTEGEHQNKLNKFSEARVGGSADAVKMAFDESLGVPVNALEKINTLKKNAKDTGAKLINPVVDKSGTADITSIIKNIEGEFNDPVGKQTLKQIKEGKDIAGPSMSEYQQRLLQLRSDLRGDWADKDKMFLDVKGEQGLHEKQIALRREAQDLLDSSDTANKRLGGRLMSIRNQYVDAIDKISGPIDPVTKMGPYKTGLSKYADDMEVQEAFERGFSLFGKSPKITNRPEFLIEELKNAKPEVKEALKEGGRIAVDSMTRGFKNSARKGEDLVASEFNADKIKALYGKDEGTKLINKLQDERGVSNTDSKLYQNAQTAMRLKNDSRVKQPVDPDEVNFKRYLPLAAEGAAMFATGGIPTGVGAGAYMAAKGLNKYAITPIANKYRQKQNTELTNLLTAEGEQRDMLIKILEDRASPPKSTLQVIKHLALPVLPP